MPTVRWMSTSVHRAPKGKEKNWVPTNPDKGFFVVFRFYGPLEGYIDKTWVLDDFELVN